MSSNRNRKKRRRLPDVPGGCAGRRTPGKISDRATSALRLGVQLDHPAAHALGIKLLVPRSVKRVGEINALAVAADFHHLRPAIQRSLRSTRVRRLPHDSAQVDGAGKFGMERIGDVVLLEFPGAPRRDVQKFVVEGQIDVGDQRRHGLESLEQWRKFVGIGGLGGNLDYFFYGPGVFFAVPQPDGSGQILQRDHHAGKSVGFGRIVRGAQLQYHLLLSAQIKGLHVAAFSQIPHVQRVAIAAFQQNFGNDSRTQSFSACPTRWKSACRSPGATRSRIQNTAGRDPAPISQERRSCPGSITNIPPGPSPSGAPSALTKIPSGPQ